MFGALHKIFRSRWAALWWAAGMLFTAWSLVPAADPADDGSGTPVKHHANPWAKDAK
ncbi:MAG: hypothetical protein RIS94_582 [Pseudomonadota bacterium]|jgi:hypothetical protein